MYSNLIVDNPKIKTAKNNTKKCVVGIYEIASKPHYYSGQELLCTRCGDKLTISKNDGKYYLKHLKSGGSKHYTCPLYTSGTYIHNVYHIKDTFLSGLEKNLNYCVIVSSDIANVYVTMPYIKRDTLTEFRESNGKIAICCDGITYYVSSKKLSSSFSSFFKLENNFKVTKIIFHAEGGNSKIVINWYYGDALFIYKKIGESYYLNKITYEVNPNIEYAFFSGKEDEEIEGCNIKKVSKVNIENKWIYLKTIIFSENNPAIDDFLLKHDCSFSNEEKNRSNNYVDILKGDYQTPVEIKEEDINNEEEQEETNEQTLLNARSNNKHIGQYVYHKEHGQGYIVSIYPKKQFIVNFNGRERIIPKERLIFLELIHEEENKSEDKVEKSYLGNTLKINGKIRIDYAKELKGKKLQNTSNNQVPKKNTENKDKDYDIGQVVTIEGRKCILKKINAKEQIAEFETIATRKIYLIKMIDGSIKKGVMKKNKKQ